MPEAGPARYLLQHRARGVHHGGTWGVPGGAVERGEIAPDVDVDLLSVTLPAVIIHHAYILGVEPTDDLILRVIDNVILPAARGSQVS